MKERKLIKKIDSISIYTIPYSRVPGRAGKEIFLTEGGEFMSLMNGKQFLYKPINGGPIFGNLLFGGMDESPFLVSLKDEPMEILKKEGEKSFYQSLIPPTMLQAQSKFSGTIRRQGDIFGLPVPFSWDDLKEEKLLGGMYKIWESPDKSTNVLKTNHTITGRSCKTRYKLFGSDNFISGMLSARDHATQYWEGTHLVSQTNHLIPDQRVD